MLLILPETPTEKRDNNIKAIKNIIADVLKIKKEQLTPEADLIFDLGADSLDLTEIQIEIEKNLYIDIPSELLYHTTLNDLYQLAQI